MNRRRTRVVLTRDQNKTIDAAAAGLSPAQRHSFLLRCAATLRLSGDPSGFVTDALVERAVAVARREVEDVPHV